MRVSVIVITYGRSRQLAECIGSLYAQTYRPLEIVVVDDCSTDDTPTVLGELARDAPGGIALLTRRHEENLGVGPARNTGIEAATGEIIAFLDDDSTARPDWIEKLVETLCEAPEIAVAGGAYDEPPDPTWAQRAAEGIVFLGDRARDVPAVTGGNMAYRGEFLRRNPFDPEVRYGADELDVCFRAAAEGLRVRLNPEARITHHHRRSIGGFLAQQFLRGKGSVWVRRKHRRGIWPQKNWVVLALLLAAVAAVALPGRAALLTLAATGLVFLIQIVGLDVARGRSLGSSLLTLPLVAVGYTLEFAGAVTALVSRSSPT